MNNNVMNIDGNINCVKAEVKLTETVEKERQSYGASAYFKKPNFKLFILTLRTVHKPKIIKAAGKTLLITEHW